MHGKREPATRKTKEYLSLPLLPTAQLTSQPLCLEQEKNNRGSNDLGIKLRKKPQLTDVKAGRQPREQTSRAQGLFRMHARIFQIIFFFLFHRRKKKVKNITNRSCGTPHNSSEILVTFFFTGYLEEAFYR